MLNCATNRLCFCQNFGRIGGRSATVHSLPTCSAIKRSCNLDKLCEVGRLHEALEIMEQRDTAILRNNAYCMLTECCIKQDLMCGRRVQSLIENGLDSISVLGDHLIRLFASCECLIEANQAFSRLVQPTVYTWNAIITAHVDFGYAETALQLYDRMQLSGIKGNQYIYVAVLRACTIVSGLDQGRDVHKQIIHGSLDSNIFVGSALVDMYAKCGSLNEAYNVFESLQDQNVVSWGAMIGGYALHGEGLVALECFEQMQQEGIMPDRVTFLSVLKACGNAVDIGRGRRIHEQIIDNGLHSDVVTRSALVDMYAKCGGLVESQKVFDQCSNWDVVTWGAMISGYAENGEGLLALEYYDKLQQQGIKPDAIVFTGVLNACNCLGLVDEGRTYFTSMRKCYSIMPDAFHYNCIVHLLVRAELFTEAEHLLHHIMKVHPNIIGWTALLNACKAHTNAEIGKRCFNEIVLFDSSHPASYVLMSNIYAACEMGCAYRHKETSDWSHYIGDA